MTKRYCELTEEEKQKKRDYMSAWNKRNRERCNRTSQKYREKNRERRKITDKACRERNKEEHNKKSREYYKKNKKKHSVRTAVGKAVLRGKIIKPEVCSKCGSKRNIQAHHEDYEKPLDVI